MTDAESNLALEFLEDINSLYLNFPEHQRASFWSFIKKQLKDQEGLVLQRHRIDELVERQITCPSFELGARLLKTYLSQVQNGPDHITPRLQNWVLDGLESLSQGKKSDEIFGLYRGKGRPKGTASYTDLQIACAYHFYVRSGYKKVNAENAVQEQFGIEKRAIGRIKKRFPIADYIDMGVLEALMERDYSDLYGEV